MGKRLARGSERGAREGEEKPEDSELIFPLAVARLNCLRPLPFSPRRSIFRPRSLSTGHSSRPRSTGNRAIRPRLLLTGPGESARSKNRVNWRSNLRLPFRGAGFVYFYLGSRDTPNCFISLSRGNEEFSFDFESGRRSRWRIEFGKSSARNARTYRWSAI